MLCPLLETQNITISQQPLKLGFSKSSVSKGLNPQQFTKLSRCHSQVTKVPGRAHITGQNSTDCINRNVWFRIGVYGIVMVELFRHHFWYWNLITPTLARGSSSLHFRFFLSTFLSPHSPIYVLFLILLHPLLYVISPTFLHPCHVPSPTFLHPMILMFVTLNKNCQDIITYMKASVNE